MHISKLIVYGVLTLFICVMAFATFLAYNRGYSGATGLDMAKVQKMRTAAQTPTSPP